MHLYVQHFQHHPGAHFRNHIGFFSPESTIEAGDNRRFGLW